MSDLEPIQHERLRVIGDQLRLAREAKGLSLEEASGKTLIRATILKAIEEGNATPLPEPVYIRGFIRRFGDVVGLQGKELCETFPWEPAHSLHLPFVASGDSLVTAATVAPVAVAKPERVEPGRAQSESLEPQRFEDQKLEPQKPDPQPFELQNSEPVELELGEEIELGDSLPPLTPQSLDPEPVVVDRLVPGLEAAIAPEQVIAEPIADTNSPPEPSPPEPSAPEPSTPESSSPEPYFLDRPTADPVKAPDPESAYASRAALFEDDEADGSGTGTGIGTGSLSGDRPTTDSPVSPPIPVPLAIAAPIAASMAAAPGPSARPAIAQEPNLDSRETTQESQKREAAPAAAVATLPPPPAPVAYREPQGSKSVPWLLPLLGAALGIGLAAFAWSNRQPGTVAESTQAPTVAETVAETAAPAAPAAAPTPAAPDAAEGVVLELEVRGTEEAWMDVYVDGKLELEGNQAAGFKQRWQGQEKVQLATARPDLVWISVNGSKPQPFGKFEEAKPVKEASFKPGDGR